MAGGPAAAAARARQGHVGDCLFALQLLEPEFELFDGYVKLLRGTPELQAAQLQERELQRLDLPVTLRQCRADLVQLLVTRSQRSAARVHEGAQLGRIIGKRGGTRRHR